MSREIDFDKPLSDEDKRWLHERSLDYHIEENERKFGQAKVHAEGLPVKVEIPGLEVPEPPAQPTFAPGWVPEVTPSGTTEVAEEEVEEVAPEDLTVEELKVELRERNLPTDGNKAELIKRLNKALKD